MASKQDNDDHFWPETFWPAVLCICLGFAGGFAFSFLKVPLAFMLGALAVTMVAAMSGAPIARPSRYVVMPMRACLGVLLGSTVTPELIAQLWAISGALLFVPLFIIVSTLVGTIYYHRVAKYSQEEAFFSALPGGLVAMTTFAEECGVDIRRVSLAHALRITFVVLLAPLLVSLLVALPDTDVTKASVSLFDIDLWDLTVLTAAGIVGFYGARYIRMPGAQMVGPLLVSALLHVEGVTAAKPPYEIIIISQVILGAYIGSRYVNEQLSVVRSAIVYAFGYVAITMLIAVGFGYCLHVVFGLPLLTGMLSFAPGGMAEIGLIALGLGLDVGFVATIQVSRLLAIAIFAPIAFRRIRHVLNA